MSLELSGKEALVPLPTPVGALDVALTLKMSRGVLLRLPKGRDIFQPIVLRFQPLKLGPTLGDLLYQVGVQ